MVLAELRLVFHPVERTILMIIGALAVADAVLIWWKGTVVGVHFFLFSIVVAGLFIFIGQIYRQWRDSERIALTTTAIALFVSYSVFCALFNMLLLPRPRAPIDAVLVRIDAWLGYSWPELCAWIANYPVFNVALRTVYLLTMPQYLITLVLLGMLFDRRRLHGMALATILGSLTVIFCWALFPSGGASAYWTLDPAIDRIVRPVVNSAYGAELYRLFNDGIRDVSMINVSGLIGFPSFHAVMGLVTLFAAWPYRAYRAVLIVSNALLAPAILVHGGHNLVDLLAGLAITVVAWLLALAIYDAKERAPHRLASFVGSVPQASASSAARILSA